MLRTGKCRTVIQRRGIDRLAWQIERTRFHGVVHMLMHLLIKPGKFCKSAPSLYVSKTAVSATS